MKKITTTRQVFLSMMTLALFFFGCSNAVQPIGSLDKKPAGVQKSPQQGVTFKNVDKVVQLKRMYEKDGRNFLEFHDMKEYGNKFTSLPMAKDVEVFLPNYYPENLFNKLQRDLKDPKNKNILGILYYLTIVDGEVRAIRRPLVKLPDAEIEFRKEENSVLEKTVEDYLNSRVDTMTRQSLIDPSRIKFYKNFSPYIVLGRTLNGDILDYYIWLQQRQFELQDGVVVNGMGGSIPAAMKIKIIGDSYEVLSYRESGDGSLWAPSIQKMYPPEIAKKLITEYSTKDYFPNIKVDLKAKAEDYFKKKIIYE